MEGLQDFVFRFDNFSRWPAQKQADYISYYLSEIVGNKSIFSKDIDNLFEQLSIKKYRRLPQYLSENVANKKNGKYIKVNGGGYRLERRIADEIKSKVDKEPVKIQVSKQLSDLVLKVNDSGEKSFLIEAINAYRVEAYRATIVLVWILVIDHLQSYIFGTKLNEFNDAFAKNPDRKMNKIVNYDDFSEIKESKFIELAKSAGIISNDVRKLLDEKLGIRNSAAHPSSIMFSGHKATEFILDLIDNVLLKY